MPSILWNTRVETKATNGTVVITIPRNVQLSIPSLRFEGLPPAAIQMHLNALELASKSGPQRIALRNHFENSTGVVQYNGTKTFSGAYETVRGDLPFGNNARHLNDGSANGVNINVPAGSPLILVDLSVSKINEFTGFGFKSPDAAIAALMNHGLGHYYIDEYSRVTSGHGEWYSGDFTGTYRGSTAEDVLRDDVYRWEDGLNLIGDLYSSNGRSTYLDERADVATQLVKGYVGRRDSGDLLKRWVDSRRSLNKSRSLIKKPEIVGFLEAVMNLRRRQRPVSS